MYISKICWKASVRTEHSIHTWTQKRHQILLSFEWSEVEWTQKMVPTAWRNSQSHHVNKHGGCHYHSNREQTLYILLKFKMRPTQWRSISSEIHRPNTNWPVNICVCKSIVWTKIIMSIFTYSIGSDVCNVFLLKKKKKNLSQYE